jgi:hypothetical protein
MKIIGLGIGIWGLSLLWPEINQGLTNSVLAGIGLLLCLIMLAYGLVRFFDWRETLWRPRKQHSARSVLKLLP